MKMLLLNVVLFIMTSQIYAMEKNQTVTHLTTDVIKDTTTQVAVTSSKPIDLACTNNYGKCASKGSCEEDYSVLEGICGNKDLLCCVPSQKVEKSWTKDDQTCDVIYGVCQRNNGKCAGVFDKGTCGGPTTRKCCSPDEAEIKSWTSKDEPCSQGLGTCQLSSLECAGVYQETTCGGPATRQCCLPSSEQQTKWASQDSDCLGKWGTCQADHSTCEGGLYQAGLCGGPDARKCCLPTKTTIDGWASKDESCSKIFGNCQHDNVHCNGTKDSKLCDGPSHRVCCEVSSDVTATWAKNDVDCKNVGGTCQHTSLECNGAWNNGKQCGGPDNRHCCVSNHKKAPKTNSEPTSVGGATHHPLPGATVGIIISGLAFIIILIVGGIFMSKTARCSPYKRVKEDMWYRTSGNSEQEESLNLTLHNDDKANYA